MSDIIKLVYFDFRGRAESLRMCFAAAGKQFEDVRIGFDKWPAERANTPYGVMPYIVYKGKTYGESRALASFVARECGLAGRTSEEAMRVDEVFCLVSGLLESLAKALSNSTKRAEGAKTLAAETFPTYYGYFERLLKENGKGYFVGSALTLADLSVYDVTESCLKVSRKALDDYPHIQRMKTNVEADANVKAYLASRPPSDK